MSSSKPIPQTMNRRNKVLAISQDDMVSINVGGKKYLTRRSTLVADPKSRLAEWFKTANARSVPTDKQGNNFLDRDGKCFRYILAYLRCKKEGQALNIGLPLKPDEVARLIAEADWFRLKELRELCYEMLQVYQREELNFVSGYVKAVVHECDDIEFENKRGRTASVTNVRPAQYEGYD